MKKLQPIGDNKEYVIKIVGNGYVGMKRKMNVSIQHARRFLTHETAEKHCGHGQLIVSVKSQLEE